MEINQELITRIQQSKENDETIELNFDSNNKSSVFYLGMLFAGGLKVKCSNSDHRDYIIENEDKIGKTKSLNKMIKYWEEHSLSPEFVDSELDTQKAYLICPVRKANEDIQNTLKKLKKFFNIANIKLHYPAEDTKQEPFENGVNTGGYNICMQNVQAISDSHIIECYYDPSSIGSMFDLGATYYLMSTNPTKIFQLANSIAFTETTPGIPENDFGKFAINTLLSLSQKNSEYLIDNKLIK